MPDAVTIVESEEKDNCYFIGSIKDYKKYSHYKRKAELESHVTNDHV